MVRTWKCTVLAATLCTLSSVAASSVRFDLSSALDQLLNVYAPVSSVLAGGPCKAQGLLYKQAVKDGQSWALNMLDSSSKLPFGMLAGNLYELGNIDQCLAVQHTGADGADNIVGQHCTVAVGAANFFTLEDLFDRFDEYAVYHTQLLQIKRLLNESKTAEAFSEMGVTLSVCVPAACTPADVQLHLRSALKGWLGDAVNVTVYGNACRIRRDSVFSAPYAKEFSSLFIFVATLLAAGTLHDFIQKGPTRNCVLVAFSVLSNGRNLLRASPAGNTLFALDGIRTLSALAVILSHHTLFINHVVTSVNYHQVLERDSDWYHIAITNANVSVDSFLLLGGTLLAYNFFAERQKGSPISLFKFYFRRYIRITPGMACSWYFATALTVASSSSEENPHSVSQTSGHPATNECENFWWLSYLYITNYFPNSINCVGAKWYLSVDMQLVWISPLVLFVLWRWPRIGKALMGSLVAAGVAIGFALTYVNDISVNLAFNTVAQRRSYHETVYVPTHARFTPWVIGLALGRLLHTSSKSAPPALSKTHVAVGWFLSVTLLLTSLLSAHRFFQGGQPYDKMATALYVAFMRPAWASGLALLVFFCATGYGGFMNAFLSWRGFLVPSRLSFAVYLSHMAVLSSYHTSKKHPMRYNDLSMVVEFLGLSVISFLVALVFHLAVEAPAVVLGRCLQERLGKASKSIKSHRETTHLRSKSGSKPETESFVVKNKSLAWTFQLAHKHRGSNGKVV